ncbi:MAG: protoglobin domain-containing protein [Acidimicrobiales bacterium]
MTQPSIAGYRSGDPALARSPVSLDDLALIEATLLLGPDDVDALRTARAVVAPYVEEVLDVWYAFVGDNPHLLAAFTDADGQPDTEYLAAVRARFGQWILDTTAADFDQSWLDWQHEIGLRHHRTGKNRTDDARAVAPLVPFRYLVALTYPIFATIRPFLERGGHPPVEVSAMQHAWLKAVLLQVILWSQPYVNEGDY